MNLMDYLPLLSLSNLTNLTHSYPEIETAWSLGVHLFYRLVRRSCRNTLLKRISQFKKHILHVTLLAVLED